MRTLAGRVKEWKIKSNLRYDPELTLEDLHAAIEASYDGLLVTDGKGNILVVNEAYLKIAAVPEEGIIGRNLQEFVDQHYLEKSVALMAIQKKETGYLHSYQFAPVVLP